jgi:surface protein
MSGMFSMCQKLSSLTLSESFNTANVTDMSNMFSYCNMLEKLNLSNFNTTKVEDMSYMFYMCQKLTELNLSNFKTEKVKKMSCMFSYCSMLEKLNLSNFNTAEVTNMSQMFYTCKELPSLDLTNFNTAKVTNMQEMFKGCSTLQTIYVSDNFVVTGITDENYKKDLFTGCEALPEYGYAKTSSDYANYKTGYFTKLVVRNGDERYGIKGETTQLTVDNLVLADNKDFVAYDPFKATAASYNRTINTTWATLCLPFEVSLDNQNFRAFELGSVSNNEVVLKELNTIIPAGTPVIIKMNDGETQLNFSVADKAIAKDVKTSETADGNYQLQGLYTQKLFDKAADNNCYIVKGNKLMNPAKLMQNTNKETVGSKPFRAYMIDKSSAPAAGAKMFSIGFDNDGTTAIDNLNTIANDNAIYYDLQGHRLNAPQKGINIVKRGNKTMKVIIK